MSMTVFQRRRDGRSVRGGMRNVSYFKSSVPKSIPFYRRKALQGLQRQMSITRLYPRLAIPPPEVKHIIWQAPPATLQYTPANNGFENVWLSDVNQGIGQNQRVGSKIYMKNLSVKMSLSDNTQNTLIEPHVIRVIIWRLKTAMSAITTVHNILLNDSSNYNSLVNVYQGQNIHVYFDQTFQMNAGYNGSNPGANSPHSFNIQEFRQINQRAEFTLSESGNQSPTNQLFMSIFSNSPQANMGTHVSYYAKLSYVDN